MRALTRPFIVASLVAVLLGPSALWAQDGPIILRTSTVLDGRGAVLRDTSIVVEGTTIASLDPSRTGSVYDLRGLTVLPGWIDTHIHSGSGFNIRTGRPFPRDASAEEEMLYQMENLHRTLMGGFTTVQSLGSARRDLQARAFIESGRLPGPRLLTSLRSVDHNTGDPEAIRAFVREVVAEGADVIKVLATASVRDGGAPTMSYEQVFAACDEARRLNRRSVLHAQSPEGAIMAPMRCRARTDVTPKSLSIAYRPVAKRRWKRSSAPTRWLPSRWASRIGLALSPLGWRQTSSRSMAIRSRISRPCDGSCS